MLRVWFAWDRVGSERCSQEPRCSCQSTRIQPCTSHLWAAQVSNIRIMLYVSGHHCLFISHLTAFVCIFVTYTCSNVWEAVYVQYLMGVNGVIVDRVEISNAVAGFSKPDFSGGGAGADGAKHQAFSQQQLGFLLRLIPELIEQQHWKYIIDHTAEVTSQFWPSKHMKASRLQSMVVQIWLV